MSQFKVEATITQTFKYESIIEASSEADAIALIEDDIIGIELDECEFDNKEIEVTYIEETD